MTNKYRMMTESPAEDAGLSAVVRCTRYTSRVYRDRFVIKPRPFFVSISYQPEGAVPTYGNRSPRWAVNRIRPFLESEARTFTDPPLTSTQRFGVGSGGSGSGWGVSYFSKTLGIPQQAQFFVRNFVFTTPYRRPLASIRYSSSIM